MQRQSLFLAFLAVLIFVLPIVMSRPAHADVISDINTFVTNCNTTVQNNLTSAAQDVQAAKHNILKGVPPLDARVGSCLTTIRSLFVLNGTMSNPLDFLGNLAIQYILSLVDQVCSLALSTLQSIKDSALSLINLTCIPMPGYGLGGFDLSLPQLPCNGSNILGQALFSGPAPPGQTPRINPMNMQ